MRKREKDLGVRDRIMLNVLVERDEMTAKEAALHLGMSPSWGVKWRRRYLDEGRMGLQTRPRPGRPPRVPRESMEEIRKKAKKIIYLTAEEMRDLIRDMSGIWYAVEYGISYVRKLLRSWGFTRKVPVGRHVRRANRQKIAWFRKKIKPLIEEKRNDGYAICVQDEAIVVADARLRRGVYTPKGVRAVYTYTGSHAKTIVFGLITADGNGFFKRYSSFTKDEFVDFLKEAHQRFGKILMIVDGAPQHKAQIVKETVKDLDGLELKFLPPGCPDLNTIEELWRQMKHAVLDKPYVRFGQMCKDIDEWLESSMPVLGIEKYLYRVA